MLAGALDGLSGLVLSGLGGSFDGRHPDLLGERPLTGPTSLGLGLHGGGSTKGVVLTALLRAQSRQERGNRVLFVCIERLGS